MDKIIQKSMDGSSVIETIVASVVFIVIFLVSASIFAKISIYGNRTDIFIESDKSYRMLVTKYLNEYVTTGIYTHRYYWGKIVIIVSDYNEGHNFLCIEAQIIDANEYLVAEHTQIRCVSYENN